ncbi:MAG: DUF4139 domain-containing protein, partial [FCB group bacterium]|nr:DUF4139 domain-containing protein [FCB group bacterium]
SLTVYNSDLGVVREVRNLSFVEGDGRIAFTDVAARIDATSVAFTMADTMLAVDILEQNYAYDLVSPEKIYGKYIDSKIDIVTEKGELFSGTLLSFSGGYLVIKADDGRIKSIVQGTVRDVTFPELPEGLITRPTLFWLYRSGFTGAADAVVSYQTSGISWQAEYVGVLGENDDRLDLTGWVSINNRSGKTYKNAKLKVIAGDIHRAQSKAIDRRGMIEFKATGMPMAAGFEEKAFFEYHLYTLPRPSTIADNEIKQLSMFDPTRAEVKKELKYNAEPGRKDVNVFIKTRNSEQYGLGMPLPAGRFRIFKADSDGAMILLGEDRIGHTPRNEEVKLNIGKAFDVVGETTVVSRRRISDKVDETDFRIELRNQKDEAATVIVSKYLGGFWDIPVSSVDFVKKSANEIEWTLDIPAEDTATIDVTVRTTRR